jgi:hypothetical protein
VNGSETSTHRPEASSGSKEEMTYGISYGMAWHGMQPCRLWLLDHNHRIVVLARNVGGGLETTSFSPYTSSQSNLLASRVRRYIASFVGKKEPSSSSSGGPIPYRNVDLVATFASSRLRNLSPHIYRDRITCEYHRPPLKHPPSIQQPAASVSRNYT